MTFAEKIRQARLFQKVTNKVEKSAMNYIKRFQNALDLSVFSGKQLF